MRRASLGRGPLASGLHPSGAPAARPFTSALLAAVLLAAAALLAGCGHSSTSTSTPLPLSAPPQSSHTAAASTTGTGCSNADVTAAVKAALVQADGRPDATEVAGATFYGTCGTTRYAVTRMTLGPAGTELQGVAFQDGGAYPELLVDTGTSWTLITRSATPTGCTASPVLPAALRTVWQDCAVLAPSSPAPSQTAAAGSSCEQYYAGKVFVSAKAVTVHADGSAVLTGAPVTVHCGGPDDFQFDAQPGTTTVDLAVGATITVVGPTTASTPLAVSKLPAYVTSGKAESDVFLVTGVPQVLTGTEQGETYEATAIAEQFHP